jgi:hypothetical protein
MFLQFFTAAIFCRTALASSRPHFQNWYPEFGAIFEEILHTQCSEQFNRYLTETPGPGCTNCFAGGVATCILAAFDENGKAMLAAAGVLLGLLPTTLSLVGPSIVETGILAQRRPFLAFLLAFCSPSASPIKTFDYCSPRELLQQRPGGYRVSVNGISIISRSTISVLEYLLTGAALANLALVTWELSIKTVTAVAAVTAYLPALWVSTSIIIHVLGAWAVKLRVSIVQVEHVPRAMDLFNQEWIISAAQPVAVLQLKPEKLLFIVSSWLASTSTVLHLVFGTLVLSGTLFISPRDALAVVARYFVSTLVCRIILMYEICGMRETIAVESEQELE